jgi:hypothetical protein
MGVLADVIGSILSRRTNDAVGIDSIKPHLIWSSKPWPSTFAYCAVKILLPLTMPSSLSTVQISVRPTATGYSVGRFIFGRIQFNSTQYKNAGGYEADNGNTFWLGTLFGIVLLYDPSKSTDGQWCYRF